MVIKLNEYMNIFTLCPSLSRTPAKALPIPHPAPVTMETFVAMIHTDVRSFTFNRLDILL